MTFTCHVSWLGLCPLLLQDGLWGSVVGCPFGNWLLAVCIPFTARATVNVTWYEGPGGFTPSQPCPLLEVPLPPLLLNSEERNSSHLKFFSQACSLKAGASVQPRAQRSSYADLVDSAARSSPTFCGKRNPWMLITRRNSALGRCFERGLTHEKHTLSTWDLGI